MKTCYTFLLLVLLFNIVSCSKDTAEDTNKDYLLGGETTITSSGPDAFTFPLPNLSDEELKKHFKADAIFGDKFVTAPAIVSGGLGPLFNQNSCEGCHIRNGRGIIPQYLGDQNTSLLLRLSIPGLNAHGEVAPVPGFGSQLQHKSIFGIQSEGTISYTEKTEIVHFANGIDRRISKLDYSVASPYIPLPSDVLISPRVAPPVHGLGLLEAISEYDIIKNKDENDSNNDGISGKPNYVWDIIKQKKILGRFGWKAEQPTAKQQAADAAHNDMGLTNAYFPIEHCIGQSNCKDGLQNTLDLDDESLDLLSFYFQTLAVPMQRNYSTKDVIKGKKVFEKIGCAKCHIPNFKTSNHDILALSNQNIYPYTDLLLHDMGVGLADNRPTFDADGQEWRTSPLWGIGLTQVINPKATFLHDGRAKTLEEAILWHGGEADKSKEKYTSLSEAERDALLTFLKSL